MIAYEILLATLLFLGGICVLGLGAWIWARAIAEVFRARAHHVAARSAEETYDASEEALSELGQLHSPASIPTEAELRQAARMAAAYERGGEQEYTTQGNEQDPERGISPDSFYTRGQED